MRKLLFCVAVLIFAGALTAPLFAAGLGAAAAAATRNSPPATKPATKPADTKPVDYYALSSDEFFKLSALDQRIGKDAFNLQLLEAAVFHQTNVERVTNKLPIFKYSAAMDLMARDHSREMSDLQYFEHQSPTPANASLGDRLKNVGLVNVTAGENIAVLPAKEMGSGSYVTHPGQGDDVWFDEVSGKKIDFYTYRDLAKEVLRQWMNSPHHHENIVNKQYVYLGVGIWRGPYDDKKQDSFYFTQNFCGTKLAASEARAEAKLASQPLK